MTNGSTFDIIYILNIIWFLFSHGGWVLFVLLAIYLLYQMYMGEIQGQYLSSIEWVLLEIKPPKDNPTSFYNAEQVFIQLHQLFDNWTFQEKYLEGKIVFTVSFEIVSLGGKISYLIRAPKKQQDLIEAALYANYPSIEITEVKDYLENFHYSPDDPRYDLFGAEFIPVKSQAFPIRTYREFESLKGPELSEIVVDPLAPLLETYTKIGSQEFYGLQIIIQPVMDNSWKEEVENEVEKVLGEKTVVSADGKKTKVKNDMMGIDEIVKQQVTAMKNKLNRPGFSTKIRFLHLGTAEQFNKNAKKLVLSPFRIFSSGNFNSLKPAFGPKKDYRISPNLEAAYINYWVKNRKKDIFNGYKGRSTWVGEKTFILNTEELATLYHFPITTPGSNQTVESLDTKKIQPPANLPIDDL